MIIELKYWEGVEEETVTIWTLVLHYPNQVFGVKICRFYRFEGDKHQFYT